MNKKELKQIWVDKDFHRLLKEQATRNELTISEFTRKIGKKNKLSVDNFEEFEMKKPRFNL